VVLPDVINTFSGRQQHDQHEYIRMVIRMARSLASTQRYLLRRTKYSISISPNLTGVLSSDPYKRRQVTVRAIQTKG